MRDEERELQGNDRGRERGEKGVVGNSSYEDQSLKLELSNRVDLVKTRISIPNYQFLTTLGSLGSCVTILGREVFSTVSSQFEYEESEKNYAKN